MLRVVHVASRHLRTAAARISQKENICIANDAPVGLGPLWGCGLRGFVPSLFTRGVKTEGKSAIQAESHSDKNPTNEAPPVEDKNTFVVNRPLKDVTPEDAGRFVVFTEQESAEYLPEGCPSLEREFGDSGSRRLLLRDDFFRLQGRVAETCGEGVNVKAAPAQEATILLGNAGSGKSVLLAMTVAWARANGWVVLYVPQGRLLTQRSTFSRHAATGKFDTPDHARDLLRSLDVAHGAQLKSLPRQLGDAAPKETLDALVTKALTPGVAPSVAVDAALDMIDELRRVTEVPVMIAVDELNALSEWSEYHVVAGPKSRRRIEAGDLRVAAAVRDATKPFARGTFLGAVSQSIMISPRLLLQAVQADSQRTVEGFSLEEVEAMLYHYAVGGLVDVESPEQIVGLAAQLRILASGNGEEIRRNALVPSLGGLVSRVGRRTAI